MKLVTQTEAAQAVDRSQPYISKLVREGRIYKYEDSKVDLHEVQGYVSKGEIKDHTEETSKQQSKKPTLADAKTHKEAFNAKMAELRYKEKSRELIPLKEAKAVFEKVATPINQAMNDLPSQLKARYPDIDNEAIQWLTDRINSIKMSIQGFE